jgi:hypothetical protein
LQTPGSRFEALQSGAMPAWRMGHSGYLPGADLIFALALFLQAKSLNPDLARACLKPHLAAMLRRAQRDLADRRAITAPVVEAMQAERK